MLASLFSGLGIARPYSWQVITVGGDQQTHPTAAPAAGWETEIENALMAAGIIART